jgi:hypothetical protein
VGLLALEGGQSIYGFFTRGPVISGEPISLRASAVINQMRVFFARIGTLK